MRHHTNDPAQKAADIANMEADIVWKETHNFNLYVTRWIEVFDSVLMESAQ